MHKTNQRFPAHVPPRLPACLQAGGKDGVVSVFGSRELECGRLVPDAGAPALLSQKLHRGWISDVQFAGGSGGDSSGGSGDAPGAPLLLLTAGNDGAVCLWDLGKAAEVGGGGGSLMPQCLAKATDLHTSEWVPLGLFVLWHGVV